MQDEILEEIRQKILPYTTKKKRNKKPWHWRQDWAKAELLFLGRKKGFRAIPEYPCFNPESRSGAGRIDVVWEKEPKQPVVAIEISKRAPTRRDLAKLAAFKERYEDCLVVVVTMRAGKARPHGKKPEDWHRPSYGGLNLEDIWIIPHGTKAKPFLHWLKSYFARRGKRLVEPLFNKD